MTIALYKPITRVKSNLGTMSVYRLKKPERQNSFGIERKSSDREPSVVLSLVRQNRKLHTISQQSQPVTFVKYEGTMR
ncbi:MAG: hypothetical protein ACFB2X_27320 [Rivularia sp. (in: cyanobacteria)]